jgi:ATP-dependent DNA ligase
MRKPTIYHKGKNGLVQWTGWTEGDTIYVEHGQVGGAMQRTPGIKCEAKNVGRANATTAEEQAERELEAMWKKRLDRKYSLTKEDAQEDLFLPMLAKTFKDVKKPKEKWGRGIKYPADVQPKLDGVRCLVYWDGDSIYMGTRNGLEWTAPRHIAAELEKYMPLEMVLDGELYIHGVDFESLTSWTKKIYPETAKLEFHVFDMPLDENGNNGSWNVRRDRLRRWFNEVVSKQPNSMLRMVATVENVKNRDEVLAWEEKFVEQGYEGAMVRNRDDEYIFGGGHESIIQKVKSSVDDEYKIVAFTHGKGKEINCVKWICELPNGERFDVRPKGSQAKREEWYRTGNQYIGEWLKVRYQNLTKDGVPRFPRGLGFRDPRDMDKKKKKK